MENWHTTEQKRVKKLSVDSLRYTITDCGEAIEAYPENPKCGQYQDTIHYCYAELKKRERKAA